MFLIIVFISRKSSRCICIYFRAIMPSDQRVIKFSNYLVDNYITNDATFPPHLWANQSANLNRTANACESFYSHLKNSFYKSHPNVHIFSKVLIEFQTQTYIKLNGISQINKLKN